MAVFTVISTRRPQEYDGVDFDPPYPPCCGRTPMVLVWASRRKSDTPDVAVRCTNPDCPLSEEAGERCGWDGSAGGVFAGGHEDARRKWEGARRP